MEIENEDVGSVVKGLTKNPEIVSSKTVFPEMSDAKNPLTVNFTRPESNEQLAEVIAEELVVLAILQPGVAPETYWMEEGNMIEIVPVFFS